MTDFEVHIADKIERQVRHVRASLRDAIEARLAEIRESANRAHLAGTLSAAQGPPLRFYVTEGYRISYTVDPVAMSIVVVDLQVVPAS